MEVRRRYLEIDEGRVRCRCSLPVDVRRSCTRKVQGIEHELTHRGRNQADVRQRNKLFDILRNHKTGMGRVSKDGRV
jgi:hypothetical protein